jgi:hypothetical protein
MPARIHEAQAALTTGASELMSTTEVMLAIGYETIRSAAGWCRRWDVQAVHRAAGSHGENQYPRDQVAAAIKRAQTQGRGYRKDLLCHQCGKGRPDGVMVHRQNPGVLPPVWACDTHDVRQAS